MWSPILEKAWAKVKGSYENANGGFVSSGIRSIVGSPVFIYETAETDDDARAHWTKLNTADGLDYIMGTGTAGNGNDQENNSCGIAMSHAYSIISAFEFTDADTSEVSLLYAIRNPWGVAYYSGDFDATDSRWDNSANVDQVPLGIDPTDTETHGIFIAPYTVYLEGSECFSDFQIGHYRDGEGYSTTWYDALDMEDGVTDFYFTTTDDTSDLYFSAESYYQGIVPYDCYVDSDGSVQGYPLLLITVYEPNGSQFSY